MYIDQLEVEKKKRNMIYKIIKKVKVIINQGFEKIKVIFYMKYIIK